MIKNILGLNFLSIISFDMTLPTNLLESEIKSAVIKFQDKNFNPILKLESEFIPKLVAEYFTPEFEKQDLESLQIFKIRLSLQYFNKIAINYKDNYLVEYAGVTKTVREHLHDALKMTKTAEAYVFKPDLFPELADNIDQIKDIAISPRVNPNLECKLLAMEDEINRKCNVKARYD